MSERVIIEIRVRANASNIKVGGIVGEPPRLIVAVQAPAVDGKANDAIVIVLAKAFDLRTRDFSIVHGELSRDKRISINGNRAQIEDKYAELSKLGNK